MMDSVKIIDRYLGRNTIQGVLLVLSVLVVLFSLIELLVQLNDVGKGDFRMADAFGFVALTIPKRVADLMPLAALLGSIVALGLLADHQELTAMQVAGMSVQRISTSVLATSVLIMLTTIVIAEFVAPPLDQEARVRRSRAIYGKGVMMTKSGFWVRHAGLLVHVGQVFTGGRAADVEVYELDEAGRLRQFIYARQAILQEGKDWLLPDVEVKTFADDTVTTQSLPEYRLASFLAAGQVAVLELPPDSLSLSDLQGYIQILQERKQNARSYALAFWQKICLPVTTGTMVLLSLTFIFGSTRMRTAGQRILTGMLVGIVFYLANQILGQLGLILELPPLVITLAPVGLILLVALRLLKRIF